MAEPVNDVYLDKPINTLVSYHYFNDADIAEMAGWGLCMVGDSGAFSAASQGVPIDRDEFYEWARRWSGSLLWTAALDVIGDEEMTWANYVTAPSDLRLVPTVHYGAKPSAIDRYVEAGADLIGLGGMVPLKGEPARLLRWSLEMMRYARDRHPHVRFHGWGVTHPELVMNLPWWSVDSSGVSAAYRYGRMTLVDPNDGSKVTVALNGKDIAAYAHVLQRDYGIDWRRVASSTTESRRDVVRVAMRGMQHLESFLRRRWKIEPPESLKEKLQGLRGRLLHNVMGLPTNWQNNALQSNDHPSPNVVGPQLHYVLGTKKREGEYLATKENL